MKRLSCCDVRSVDKWVPFPSFYDTFCLWDLCLDYFHMCALHLLFCSGFRPRFNQKMDAISLHISYCVFVIPRTAENFVFFALYGCEGREERPVWAGFLGGASNGRKIRRHVSQILQCQPSTGNGHKILNGNQLTNIFIS